MIKTRKPEIQGPVDRIGLIRSWGVPPIFSLKSFVDRLPDCLEAAWQAMKGKSNGLLPKADQRLRAFGKQPVQASALADLEIRNPVTDSRPFRPMLNAHMLLDAAKSAGNKPPNNIETVAKA